MMVNNFFFQEFDENTFFEELDTQNGTEENNVITKTLTELALLYGVPAKYIVPDELYLKEESVNFFYIDNKWIKTLLDGAMSIGRNGNIDYRNDTLYIEKILADIPKNIQNIRLELQGKEPISNAAGSGNYTGFIMRSRLVPGFRGLEFKAYEGDKLLTALRIETLAYDVLLAIFEGNLSKVVISEPPEGLHYGFLADSKSNFTKTLRNVSNGELNTDTVKIHTLNNRIVDYCKIASEMESKLKCSVDSAVMGLELVQNACDLVITKND